MCGSDSNDSGGGGGSGSAAKKVGVILPDATTSPRWEANDRPSLKKAFDDAGIESDIQNAERRQGQVRHHLRQHDQRAASRS